MPSIKEIGSILEFRWDDDSTEQIKIETGTFEDSGDYVHIKKGDDSLFVNSINWPLIRDKVDQLLSENKV